MADLLDFIPVVGQIRAGYRAGAKEAQDKELLRERERLENEGKKLALQKIKDLFQENPEISKARESVLRDIVGVPTGPLVEPDIARLELAKEQSQPEIVKNYGNFTIDQAKSLGLDLGKTVKPMKYFNPDTREIFDTEQPGTFPIPMEKAVELRTAYTKEKSLQDYQTDQKRIEDERRAKLDSEKPLSGDAAKVESIATTVIPEVEMLKSEFEKDYKKALTGIVTGTDRRLVKLVDNIADKVGRLRSGGAINKDEEARFKRQIASAMDIPFGESGDALSALDGIITEANKVSSNIRPKGVARFVSPLQVKEAVAKGSLSKEEAKKILQSQFGFN